MLGLGFLLVGSLLMAPAQAAAGAASKSWNYTVVDKLKHDLLAHYDKFARPALHHSNTTVVKLDLNFKHVDLDEMTSILTVYAWAKMVWNDEKLMWNSSEYDDIKTIHLADHEVWQPDITLYNSAQGSEVDHYGNTHCIVQEDGSVLWVPPAEFHSFCQIDMHNWPYDVQQCTISLGSWTYDGEQIDLQLDDTEATVELNNISQWDVMDVQKKRNLVYYECCPEPYVDVTYIIHLSRRSGAYQAVAVTPIFVLMLILMAVFVLPTHSGEKIILSGLTILIVCLMLVTFSSRLPVKAFRPPLIISYYGWFLVLAAFALIESVVVIRLSRCHWSQNLPWFVKRFLTSWVGSILMLNPLQCLPQGRTESAVEEMTDHDEEQNMMRQDEAKGAHQGWLLLASAIDRLFLAVYSFIFLIMALCFHF